MSDSNPTKTAISVGRNLKARAVEATKLSVELRHALYTEQVTAKINDLQQRSAEADRVAETSWTMYFDWLKGHDETLMAAAEAFLS